MTDGADEQEAVSIGCTVLVFSWIMTFFGGVAVGFWVLK